MVGTPTSSAGGSHESGGGGGEPSPQSGAREQDCYLPIANISRIMKKALPANGKIAKEAKDTVQECVSEFISFITSVASEKCKQEKRKTINGDDLLWVMVTLGFEDYIKLLKIYLARYREISSLFALCWDGPPLLVLWLESDTRGSIRGGDGSRRDADGAFPSQNAPVMQFALQGSMNYVNDQGHGHHLIFPSMQDQ